MQYLKRFLNNSINSIWAGVMIAIGAVIYINCPNKIVGAFLFSIGLIVIMSFGFNLYTGAVGYVRKFKDIPLVINIFLMNFVGCAFIAYVPTNGASEIMQAKLECGLMAAFIKGIICGILIFVCVAHKKDIRITMIAIPAFILCGAEHSVADIAFAFAAKSITLQTMLFVLVVAIGNAIGALAISIWIEMRTKNELHTNK